MKKFLIPFLLYILLGVSILPLGDRVLADGPEPEKNANSVCSREKIAPGLWMLLGRPAPVGTAFGGNQERGISRGDQPYVGFAIRFVGQADYSHCLSLPSPLEVRICIMDTLIAYAVMTQAEVRAYLDVQGVDYRSQWVNNTIWIDAGDRDLVCQLSNYDDVELLFPNIAVPFPD